MRLTRFNPETGQYECATKAKTLTEFRAQRKAVIQRLGELEENAECRVQNAEWITPTTINDRAFNVPHCSVCEGIPCGVDKNTKYCPNCGAKMKGENDEQR